MSQIFLLLYVLVRSSSNSQMALRTFVFSSPGQNYAVRTGLWVLLVVAVWTSASRLPYIHIICVLYCEHSHGLWVLFISYSMRAWNFAFLMRRWTLRTPDVRRANIFKVLCSNVRGLSGSTTQKSSGSSHVLNVTEVCIAKCALRYAKMLNWSPATWSRLGYVRLVRIS